jgi:hypothetical protein
MRLFGLLSVVIALLWFFGVAWAGRTWGGDDE